MESLSVWLGVGGSAFPAHAGSRGGVSDLERGEVGGHGDRETGSKSSFGRAHQSLRGASLWDAGQTPHRLIVFPMQPPRMPPLPSVPLPRAGTCAGS